MKRLTRYFNSGKLCLADWSEQEAINKLGELEDVVEELDRLRNQLELSQIENMQLKQAQKQLAVSELEILFYKLQKKKYTTIFGNQEEPIQVLERSQVLDYINKKIKELGGGEKEQLTAEIEKTICNTVRKLVSDFMFDLISWSDYNLAKKEYTISFEHFKRLCDYYAYEYPLKVGFKNDTK